MLGRLLSFRMFPFFPSIEVWFCLNGFGPYFSIACFDLFSILHCRIFPNGEAVASASDDATVTTFNFVA